MTQNILPSEVEDLDELILGISFGCSLRTPTYGDVPLAFFQTILRVFSVYNHGEREKRPGSTIVTLLGAIISSRQPHTEYPSRAQNLDGYLSPDRGTLFRAAPIIRQG